MSGEKVNHPKHYNSHPSGVEAIEIVEHMPFNLGNAVKYLYRAGLKEDAADIVDLKKAAWYLRREVGRVRRWDLGRDIPKVLEIAVVRRVVAGETRGTVLCDLLEAYIKSDGAIGVEVLEALATRLEGITFVRSNLGG